MGYRSGEALTQKSQELSTARDFLLHEVSKVCPHFSILVYGSSVYGLNPEAADSATFRDLDCLIVIPDGMNEGLFFDELLQIVSDIEISTQDGFTTDIALQRIVRVAGCINGIKISFHCVAKSTLRKIVSYHENHVWQVRPATPEYESKSYFERMYGFPFIVFFEPAVVQRAEFTILVKQYLHRRNEEGSYFAGTLTDRWLINEVVWDPEEVKAGGIVEVAIRSFVHACLFRNPSMSADDLVNMYIRAGRFSPDFYQKMLQKFVLEKAKYVRDLTGVYQRTDDPKKKNALGLRLHALDMSTFPMFDETTSQVIESLPSPKFSPAVKIDTENNVIYKKLRRFRPKQILSAYFLLKSVGIRVGEQPVFKFDDGQVIQVSSLEKGQDGAEFLANCSELEFLQFFEETILLDIYKVLKFQESLAETDRLYFSFDPIPNNYIRSESGTSTYIDYEPVDRETNSDSPRLDRETLVLYGSAKMIRNRPELFVQVMEILERDRLKLSKLKVDCSKIDTFIELSKLLKRGERVAVIGKITDFIKQEDLTAYDLDMLFSVILELLSIDRLRECFDFMQNMFFTRAAQIIESEKHAYEMDRFAIMKAMQELFSFNFKKISKSLQIEALGYLIAQTGAENAV